MLDWAVEQRRFEQIAYQRTLNAARAAFRGWPAWKRDDAVAEMLGKVWATWHYNVEAGRTRSPSWPRTSTGRFSGSGTTARSRVAPGASMSSITAPG